MKLRLLAVGTRMPAWVEAGYQEYARRLPPELSLELRELPLGQRGRGQPVARAVQDEGERLLKQIGRDDRVIALEVGGRSLSTEALAEHLGQWQRDARPVSLLVGGPDGLSADCLARAEWRWSLSALTLPHPLVRVLLAEQLYRAWSLNAGHPYHK